VAGSPPVVRARTRHPRRAGRVEGGPPGVHGLRDGLDHSLDKGSTGRGAVGGHGRIRRVSRAHVRSPGYRLPRRLPGLPRVAGGVRLLVPRTAFRDRLGRRDRSRRSPPRSGPRPKVSPRAPIRREPALRPRPRRPAPRAMPRAPRPVGTRGDRAGRGSRDRTPPGAKWRCGRSADRHRSGRRCRSADRPRPPRPAPRRPWTGGGTRCRSDRRRCGSTPWSRPIRASRRTGPSRRLPPGRGPDLTGDVDAPVLTGGVGVRPVAVRREHLAVDRPRPVARRVSGRSEGQGKRRDEHGDADGADARDERQGPTSDRRGAPGSSSSGHPREARAAGCGFGGVDHGRDPDGLRERAQGRRRGPVPAGHEPVKGQAPNGLASLLSRG
jgi:hypothetical protein